jgi:hypothetical protein
VRSRMESLLAAQLTSVRVHTGPAADRLASENQTQAFTVGKDIAFVQDGYQPRTLGGGALLAHELAHTAQQRPSFGQDFTSSGSALELDANRAALSVVGLATPLSSRPSTGLHLQRCGEDVVVTPRDWREQNRAEYEAAVAKIRDLYRQQQDLTKRPGWDDKRSAQMDQLQKDMDEQVRILQRMGILRSPVDIKKRLLGTTPEDLRHIGAESALLTGDEPDKIYWGEHRKFQLQLFYAPTNVDIHIEWVFFAGTELTSIANPEYVPAKDSRIELDDFFWQMRWGNFGPTDNERGGKASDPGFQVQALVFVGGGKSPTWTYQSKWLHLTKETPKDKDLKITSPRIIQLPTPPDATGSTTTTQAGPQGTAAAPTGPQGTAAPPTGPKGTAAAPSGPQGTAAVPTPSSVSGLAPTTDYVLAGADIEFHLNFTPKGAGGPEADYKIVWSIEDMQAPVATRRLYWHDPDPWAPSPFPKSLSKSFSSPGTYNVWAELYPYRADKDSDRLAATSRQIRVISQEGLGQMLMGLQTAKGTPLDYLKHRTELAEQIGAQKALLAAGSIDESAIKENIKQLTETETKLQDQVGNPLHLADFPEQVTDFNKEDTFVTSIPAIFVHPDVGGGYPLTVFVTVASNDSSWDARVTDATTQDVIHWDGSGSDPKAAVNDAIKEWQSSNELPQGGSVYYQFTRYGWNLTGSFSTSSTKKTVMEWFDRILFVAQAVVALVLLLTPEPTGLTKAAGAALLVVGMVRSAYNIYSNLQLGRPLLDERNILEAISIVAGFIGLSGGAIASGAAGTVLKGQALTGRALTMFNIGRGVVITAALIDTGTFVYVAGEAIGDLEKEAADPNIPESQKGRHFMSTMAQLMAQGLLIVGTNVDLFRGLRPVGTREPLILDRLREVSGKGVIEIDPATRKRFEAEIRRREPGFTGEGLTDEILLAHFLEVKGTVVEGEVSSFDDLISRTSAFNQAANKAKGTLIAGEDVLTPNHIPQQALYKVLDIAGLDADHGAAVVMNMKEHIKTRTYAERGRAEARAAAARLKANPGAAVEIFQDALRADINDLRNIQPGAFEDPIKELQAFYKARFPDLMKGWQDM